MPNTLAYLSSQFSRGDANLYAAPSTSLAGWVLKDRHTAGDLKASADSLLKPDALRNVLSFDQYDLLVAANQKIGDLKAPIVNGYAALTGPFPGGGPAGTHLQDVTLYNASYEWSIEQQAWLRRMDNLYHGLADLPGALAALKQVQAAYVRAVKDYYSGILKIDAAQFGKVGQLLDASKPDEAEKTLNAISGLYPSYPSLPQGAEVDNSVTPESLGLADALAADQAMKAKLAVRIAQMKATIGDEGAVAAIRDLYKSFKQAYEARDDARVMSFIGDHWEAGDGTTLSDLQENLRSSFGMFDAITYDLQNLSIQRQPGWNYYASYDLTITSRIFRDNLTHQEKSSVNEEVSVDASGKAKIVRTLAGRFWYIQ